MRGSVIARRRPVGRDRRRRLQLGTGRRCWRRCAAIPTLLMEQNAVPGLTNRLLAPVVNAAAVTYDEARAVFRRQGVRVGQSGAAGVLRGRGRRMTERDAPPGAARVLVFGGSQGAHAINVAMVEAAPRLAAAAPRVAITHQTGERDLEMVRDGYRRAGLEARVEPFLFAMDREMKAADVVVCRAGATTLAELTAAGRAVDPRAAADGHRRSPAQERGGAGEAGRGADGRAARADRRSAGRRDPRRWPRDAARRRAMSEAARAAGAARRGQGDRRSRSIDAVELRGRAR